MTGITYADSGVNIEAGDQASKFAYTNAKKTFRTRIGKIGTPFIQDGGFAGALDFGDYLVIQNDDGVGTKLEIGERTGKYDTLGEDLLAMVVDDAICVGAEVISVSNTIDVPKVMPTAINDLTNGLAMACQKEQVVIPGGEVAELGNALNKMVWNATAVGVVKKDKFITGKTVATGQAIIGLKGRVLRSNGTSLARKICEKNFGANWHETSWKDGQTWGEVLLTPSKIFHRTLLDTVLGDFETLRKFYVHGIVHITGGGVPGNFPRIFSDKTLGAEFTDLHEPHAAIKDLVGLGNVADEEAYQTWHCGTAMMLVVNETDVPAICAALNETDPELMAKRVGKITNSGIIALSSKFSDKTLTF